FQEGLGIVNEFVVSPGNFVLTPRAKRDDPPQKWILVSERDLPKSGYGAASYVAKIKEAQTKLGPHLTRSEWKQIKTALSAFNDGKPGARETLAKLVAGKDSAIPVVQEAKSKLSQATN